MHIEASWYVKGAVAILEGPYMMPTSNCKMTFYYHMSGPDTGSLTIFVNSGDEMKVILNKTGHQADNWIKGEATVKSDYAFRIHITATRGDGYQGDIAIDDIKFQVQSRCIIIIIIMIAIIIVTVVRCSYRRMAHYYYYYYYYCYYNCCCCCYCCYYYYYSYYFNYDYYNYNKNNYYYYYSYYSYHC